MSEETKVEPIETDDHLKPFYEAPDADELEEESGETTEDTDAVSDTPPEETDESTTEDEEAADGQETTSDVEEEAVEKAGMSEDQADVIRTQRQLIRDLTQANAKVQQQIAALTSKLVEGGQIDAAELESELGASGLPNERIQTLNTLQEVMRVNPAFNDFDAVCTEDNFDTIASAIAGEMQKADGGTLSENIAKAEAFIWEQPNPYKYVYDIVKSYHPDFSKPADTPPVQGKGVKKQAPPPSLSAVSGGSGGENEGWTSAKIDAMDEMELHKVPPAIYERWLANELK